MVTIYDVAAKAGVSAATVSRVFNGIKVRPDMTEAVRKAAEELGFVPNRMARRLRTSSSEIIAMMIPDIENPFFTVMTRAVEDVARARGYSVMLCNTDEDPEKEQEYLRVAVSEPVAGVILAPSSIGTRLDLAIERGVPVVCVDRHAANVEADTVVADNLSGATAAARLLFEAGYRRVACVSGPKRVETADLRHQGWAAAYREANGAEPPDDLVIRTSYTVAGGAEATHRLLSLPEPPDAIFAANNKLASGVIRVLAAEGKLPPTVGLMVQIVKTTSVASLIGLPARRLGEVAATMLLERIDGLKGPGREVVLPLVFGDEDEGIELIDGALAQTSRSS